MIGHVLESSALTITVRMEFEQFEKNFLNILFIKLNVVKGIICHISEVKRV